MSLQFEEEFSKKDWLEKMFRKSESFRTKNTAKTSLRMFDLFCQNEGLTESQMIERYQEMLKVDDMKKDPNIRGVCLSFDKFIQFLGQDHDEIILHPDVAPMPFKKKSPKSIKTYFSFVKSYLRICHAIKISTDDIKDYVTFPKLRKEPRRAISLETLKLILNNASPRRRALYYVLITSGMRIAEALALKIKNFHFNENPVRITLDAETTKSKVGRETYISSEALEKLKPLIEGKKENEKIFTDFDDIDNAVDIEEQMFIDLRKRLGLLEKYPNSPRYIVNLHCFRAYFYTKASQKHGSDYANALIGHGAYLEQYFRKQLEEKAKMYKELEPDLFIESVKLETEKKKDDTIEKLQKQMQEIQDEMTRIKFLNKT